MKIIKRINNWIIKEKKENEIPQGYTLKQGYAVFTPDKKLMEDNLTYQQAVEFCVNNTDWIQRTTMIGRAYN